MRILLLSDIHSNLEALEACLAAAPPHDAVANLGDIVGYGASPNEVTARARELGGTFVRGNHDKVVAGLESAESFNPVAGLAALWNRAQLTADNLDWLRVLPKGPIVVPELTGVQFVHGAPQDEDQYVVSIMEAIEPLAASSASVTFFGHTHRQGGFSLEGAETEVIQPEWASSDETSAWEMPLRDGVKYLINPGSAGQPRDDDWRAAFGVFDTERSVMEFYRVPYDLKAAQDKILEAQLPPRLAQRLATGR